MKKLLILFILLTATNFYAQVGIGTTTPDGSAMLDIQSNDSGILIPRMAAADRDNIASPATGLMVYVTDDNTFYYYDGTTWKPVNSKNGTTYETLPISTGNQTINVTDADKIVGFSLITNSHWLDANSGRMVGTWIINQERNRIRCIIQTLEHPYMKYLAISVKIDNANNTIELTNYTSRYWKITEALPQNTFSNDSNAYQLEKIVLIKKQ